MYDTTCADFDAKSNCFNFYRTS